MAEEKKNLFERAIDALTDRDEKEAAAKAVAEKEAAEKVAADLGHFGPGGFAALEFGSLIGRPCIAAMADPEKIQRHDRSLYVGPPPGLVCRSPLRIRFATGT